MAGSKPSKKTEGGAGSRKLLETFQGKGLTLSAYNGENAIPHDATALEDCSHVDVEIVSGEVPAEFAVYFDGNQAKCLHATIYTRLKQRASPRKRKDAKAEEPAPAPTEEPEEA